MEHLKEFIDYGIIGLLLTMSVIAVAIGVERYLTFRETKLEQFKDKHQLEVHLTARLHLIATIGANAPYIGLLGTVLGIMLTFYNMGAEGVMDTKRTMTGLALALKATAFGLLVAIPAIVIYNLLLRKVKVFLANYESEHGSTTKHE